MIRFVSKKSFWYHYEGYCIKGKASEGKASYEAVVWERLSDLNCDGGVELNISEWIGEILKR